MLPFGQRDVLFSLLNGGFNQQVDRYARRISMITENVTWRESIHMDEVCTYCADRDHPQWCVLLCSRQTHGDMYTRIVCLGHFFSRLPNCQYTV